MVNDIGTAIEELGPDPPSDGLSLKGLSIGNWINIAIITIFLGAHVFKFFKNQFTSPEVDEVKSRIIIALDIEDYLTQEDIRKGILSIKCTQPEATERLLLALIGNALQDLIEKGYVKHDHGKGYTYTKKGKMKLTKISNWRSTRSEIEERLNESAKASK